MQSAECRVLMPETINTNQYQAAPRRMQRAFLRHPSLRIPGFRSALSALCTGCNIRSPDETK
jgi:hypothetical protein